MLLQKLVSELVSHFVQGALLLFYDVLWLRLGGVQELNLARGLGTLVLVLHVGKERL